MFSHCKRSCLQSFSMSLAGALYGLLAYLSGSIVPAMILHSSAAALEFFSSLEIRASEYDPSRVGDRP